MKRKYAVVFERSPNNYGAYVPDLPGCVSVGDTWEEMQAMITEAITFHIEDMLGMRRAAPAAHNVHRAGNRLPQPTLFLRL